MDKARPPHLAKKRPAILIDGDADPVSTTNAETSEQELGPTDPDGTPLADSGEASNLETVAAQTDSDQKQPGNVRAAPLAPKPARSGSSVVGGLVGALLALAGGYGLQAAGYLPTPANGSDRIAALETQFATLTSSDAGDLEGEIAALKTSVAALAQSAGDTTLATRLNDIEQKIGALSQADAKASAADPMILDRLAALESRADAASADPAALDAVRSALAADIAAMRSEIEALAATVEAQGSAPDLAAAVAATALRAAVDRGGPFAGELETLATLQPDSPAVTALRAFAAGGVPPRTELLAAFEDAAAAMLAASEPSDPDATLLERITESARGLIKVRPVGNMEGEAPAARIARMGEALVRSDDAAVETEFAGLPETARAAGEAFMARFRARAQADQLITQAVRDAAGSGN
jgi:hypothetical protein